MKKIFYIFLITFLFSGCSATKQQDSIIGQYSGKTYWMGKEMTLYLKVNGAFNLNWLNIDYTGQWEVGEKNSVILSFDEITDMSVLLSSGVILDREKEVKVLSKNKIKFENSVLKRIR